jgi:hypothetical protein
MKTLHDAFTFFFENAGFSWNSSQGETEQQGRERCALDLAKAEAQGKALGFAFAWGRDDTTNREFTDEGPEYYLWRVALVHEGEALEHLSGVDFGKDGNPYTNDYRRVVEAELASQAIHQIEHPDPPAGTSTALESINADQGLYVLREGRGFTCLGFEVCERRTLALAAELAQQRFPIDLGLIQTTKGTARAYLAYETLLAMAAKHHQATGYRFKCELEPKLEGLEGKRVEVTHPDGTKEKFKVGKSTGFIPAHLAIKSRNASGGGVAYIPEGATVRVIRR